MADSCQGELHRLWRDHVGIRPRYAGRGASALAAAANLLETSVDWSSQPPARLRGRPFLVGSGSTGVPEFLQPPREGFPPVYVPAERGEFSPEEWAVAVREATRDEAGVGAVLFRGMPLRTAKDFSRCVNSLALKPMSYEGGAAKRENVESNIIFYCQQPADPGQGGETVMVDVREILRNLDSAVVDKFRKLGIRYYRYMPERGDFFHGYNSWKK
ncbi:hypothetical protein Bbelb_277720 [Branchiostoma belcheri]|nr:hypothetical protein Bbelb_277720 [Branchiostoma belcheri]